MAGQDGSNDFLAAFGIGAVLGLGATLLLKPAADPRRRLIRRAKPHVKRVRKTQKAAEHALERAASSSVEMTGEAIESGRELLAEFRAEVERILDRARSELHEIAVEHDSPGRHPTLDERGEG